MISLNRRQFLAGSAALAGATVTSRLARAASAAGNDVHLGLIGCGWRGGQLLNAFRPIEGVRFTMLCDADEARLQEHADKAPGAAHTTDARRVLDNPEIDAVVIASCNHWHCLHALWALEAGKHVYVEKPLFHNQQEGRRLVEAVDRHKMICQVGTQQRSDPMQAEIKEFLHDEKAIGAFKHVRVNRFGVRDSIGKRSEPLPIPSSVDFKVWTGPAKLEPIYRNELHYDWHWDFNTGSGEMGNWGVHIVDDVRNNVFLDAVSAPTSVAAAGGRYAWNDAGDTPNLQLALLDAGGIPVSIGVCNLTAAPGKKKSPAVEGPDSGYVVVGEGGRLEGQRASAVAFDPDGRKLREFKGTSGMGEHVRNFIECIRTNDASKLNAPVQVGFDSTAWCDMANIATRVADQSPSNEAAPLHEFVVVEVDRMKSVLKAHGLEDEVKRFKLGKSLTFDSASQQFTGDGSNAGNGLLTRLGSE